MARARESFAGVGLFLNSFSQPIPMAASPIYPGDLLKRSQEYNRSREYIVVMTTRSNQRIRDFPLGQRWSKTTENPGFPDVQACDDGQKLLGIKELAAAADSTAHVCPPVVRLLEAEHFADLAVRQRRFELAHLAGDRRLRRSLLQRFPGGHVERDRVIRRVEHLEAESVLFEAQADDLAEVARVDIAPGVALAHRRVGGIALEW